MAVVLHGFSRTTQDVDIWLVLLCQKLRGNKKLSGVGVRTSDNWATAEREPRL